MCVGMRFGVELRFEIGKYQYLLIIDGKMGMMLEGDILMLEGDILMLEGDILMLVGDIDSSR